MEVNYTLSGIVNGQYEVAIDLAKWLSPSQISDFKEKIYAIGGEDSDFASLCNVSNGILRYKSESLFSLNTHHPTKKKIMVILGNPASHSVAKGMFFYSRKDGKKHPFWKKLEIAKLMKSVTQDSRACEATERKQIILEGNTSDEYVLGLTTFYSFPTPVKPTRKDRDKYPLSYEYGNVAGVEKLFGPILEKVQEMEYERLISYNFSKSAKWVFTQLSSYDCVKSFSNVYHWPLRGNGSAGSDLRKILITP